MQKPSTARPDPSEAFPLPTVKGEVESRAKGEDSFGQFERELEDYIAGGPRANVDLGDVRRRMDAACDEGHLTIKQWRALIDKVAVARTKAPLSRPARPLP